MEFGGHVYQQTDCAPLVADLFLNSYEADFVHLQKSKFKKQKTSFNLTFRDIDVLSLNNNKFNDYIDVIYPEEFEIKDATDDPKWANYLDLHLEFYEDRNVTHDSMTRVMTDFPIVYLPY